MWRAISERSKCAPSRAGRTARGDRGNYLCKETLRIGLAFVINAAALASRRARESDAPVIPPQPFDAKHAGKGRAAACDGAGQ